MKVLIVNKFLYPNGGSETYIFELGKQLIKMGHEVQYFGMEHADRVVGNSIEAYTSNMDFHGGNKISKLIAPFRIIYSTEARRQIRKVLDDFRPDVVHLNNINFQITPSILYEIKKWNKEAKIIATIHDPQWVCPNHMLINGRTHTGCDACLKGNFTPCAKDRCIHGSLMRSILGMVEAIIYRRLHTYRLVDEIICPSHFMERTMNANPDLQGRTIMLRNFIDVIKPSEDAINSYKEKIGLTSAGRYVLYLGRYSSEKGIHTLVEAAKGLPDIPFIFAGSGPFEDEVNAVPNIKNLGFVTGEDKYALIAGADFSLIASECYENCPFTVMESTLCGTPIVGADIGGIPELISVTDNPIGCLFESGNVNMLKETISSMWNNPDRIERMSINCGMYSYDTVEEYAKKYLAGIANLS